MFILRTTAGKFYNGRAGVAWLSENQSEAFAYTARAEAERVAATFNSRSSLHRQHFEIMEC
jgi:hypothetical protein